jgi:hypothetical protein
LSYVALTAPVASADSHLLAGAGPRLFHWRIGSDSWSEHCLKECVFTPQIVAFTGKMYALGSFGQFTVIPCHPVSQFRSLKLCLRKTYLKAWLVVCSDTLKILGGVPVRGLQARLIGRQNRKAR